MDIVVIVIGGGISGLSAAYELTRQGWRVRLLERTGRCGGLITTELMGDYVVDAGPDTIMGHKPAGILLCRELGLEDRFVKPLLPRTLHVVRGGRLRALPDASMLGFPTSMRSLLTTAAFGWSGKVRMAGELLVPPRPRTDEDESIASFVGRRFGGHAVSYLAETLLAGIHGGDASRLSMQALYPHFLAAEQTHGSMLRAFMKQSRAASGGAGAVALRGGMDELVDSLARALPPRTIVTNADVRRLARNGLYTATLASGETLTAPALVLSVPARAAAALVDDIDPELGSLCREIEHASTATIALAYPRASLQRPIPGWGMMVPPCERRQISAVSIVSSKWPDRAPSDSVLFRVAMGGTRDPGILEQPDDVLTRIADRELRSLLPIDGEPELARVYRWPDAIPQLEVGHLQRMSAIDRRLQKHPGLYITAAGFRGVGMADCIGDARSVARMAGTELIPVASARLTTACD
jgi:oxygen-dependent protoporphyrinogen oxidase